MEDEPWKLSEKGRRDLALLLCGQEKGLTGNAKPVGFGDLRAIGRTYPALTRDLRRLTGENDAPWQDMWKYIVDSLSHARIIASDPMFENHLAVAWHLLALDEIKTYTGDKKMPGGLRIDEAVKDFEKKSYKTGKVRREWCSTFYRDSEDLSNETGKVNEKFIRLTKGDRVKDDSNADVDAEVRWTVALKKLVDTTELALAEYLPAYRKRCLVRGSVPSQGSANEPGDPVEGAAEQIDQEAFASDKSMGSEPDIGEPASPDEKDDRRRKWVFWGIVVSVIVLTALAIYAIVAVTQHLRDQPVSQSSGQEESAFAVDDLEERLNSGLEGQPNGGWGPPRDLYSYGDTIDHVTLNSIVDSPTYGDERDFTLVGHVDTPPEEYISDILLQAGETYVVYTRFSNNATGDGKDYFATNVKVQSSIPESFVGEDFVYSTITSDNASPNKIWDGVRLRAPSADESFALRYVPNSAVLHTDGEANGTPLSDDLYLKGALIGFNQLDGILPPGEDFSGYVSYQFVADQPDFTVNVEAKPKGTSTDYSSTSTTREGETLLVRVTYTNTGTVTIDDVVVTVKLSEPFQHIRKSARLINSTYPDGLDLRNDEHLTAGGFNIGEYAPGETAVIEFEILNYDANALLGSDQRWLVLEDIATVHSPNGTKSADLRLVVIE